MRRHAQPSPRPTPRVDPGEDAYASKVLPLFVGHLDGRPGASLLDVGPVCGQNIRFFASRVERLYVCDLFRRLGEEIGLGRSASHAWRDLDYPAGSFDALQLWNLGDHLPDRDLGRLLELCILMLKPRGLLMAIAADQQGGAAPGSVRFVVGEGYRIRILPQPGPLSPHHCRHNREWVAAMSPFRLAKSFIYRNGLREFLFQRP